jgi:hypothetical protein
MGDRFDGASHLLPCAHESVCRWPKKNAGQVRNGGYRAECTAKMRACDPDIGMVR